MLYKYNVGFTCLQADRCVMSGKRNKSMYGKLFGTNGGNPVGLLAFNVYVLYIPNIMYF